MTVKVVVANQKGGVGKTDLVVNLSACLSSLHNRKVLLLDLDPQGNTTDYLDKNHAKLTTEDLLMRDDVDLPKIVQETETENLCLAPSTTRLSAAQVQLTNEVNMQFRLKRKMKTANGFDYIFIDTPPSLGLLTLNALTAADEVLIPIQTHYFAMDGVSQLVDTVNTIKEDLNPNLKIGGLVLTMYDRRTSLSKEVDEKVRKAFKGRVFNTVIPSNVKLAEAPSHHAPIIKYSPSSTGAQAYTELSKEYLS
ncbi:MAG: ParA family protein [Candidatus Bathyarchaeia archaeon]